MIVPMKKYAFMTYHKEYDDFLHTLRDLGVVHVTINKSVTGNAEMQELLSIRSRIKTAMNFLNKLNGETEEVTLAPARVIAKNEGIDFLDKIESLQDKKAQLITEKQALQKDIDYMQVWGEFSYNDIDRLKEAGYVVSFFTCSPSRFDSKWVDEYNAIQVNNAQSTCYFITITKAGQTIDIEAERPRMPDSGLDILNAEFNQTEENIQNIDSWFKEIAVSDYNTLEAFDRSLQDEFNFSKVVAQTEQAVDNKLMFLEGWATVEQSESIEATLDKKGFLYQQMEITEKDKMPIILKNNSYARLFEPLVNLFSLPNHTEIDPTPMLAPFFMLFFGLCFGDAGYGLLIVLVCAYLKRKSSPAMRSILSFAQWLGGTTMVVGTFIGGTVFGVALVDVPALSSIKEIFFTQDAQMKLSLVLGMVHMVYGKGVAAYKTKVQKGVKYSIAPWAWVFLLTPLLIIFGPPVLSTFGKPLDMAPLSQTVVYVCYGIAGVSILVILFYNSPGKNIVVNIGSALWAIFSMATGMLGDVLSYIRLFAVGMTGGILGGVFNMLGVEMTEGMPIVARIPLMLVVLVLGHGLNIGLCLIASMVHPARLIYVEYFKNSEYEGGGTAYVPFKKM